MAQRALRSNTPLTRGQVRAVAPSVFATEPFAGMSDRYAYVSTFDVTRGMSDAGFRLYSVSQSGSRSLERREHTRHMLRFRQGEDGRALLVGDTFAEIVLVNSHDGTSAYQLMAGLFRLVCGNGMVVSDGMIESVRVRHTGDAVRQVVERSQELVRRLPAALGAVEDWRTITLTRNEQGVYARAAHEVRYPRDEEGQVSGVAATISPDRLLIARRGDDTGDDLWSVFNRVQENAVKGGLRGYSPTGRRVRSRAVTGIAEDVRLNRALWTLTERMAALKRGNG